MRVSMAVGTGRAAAAALMALAIAACGRSHDAAKASATDSTATTAKAATPKGCDADNGGLTLPNGFCASVFADHLGHPRHLAVAPNGVVYVNTWSGRYYGNDTTPAGGFLVALRDTSGSGHADVIQRFGPDAKAGGHGGTGIALHGAWLFAEESDRIVRYAMPTAGIAPTGRPDVVVSGMPLGGDHPMHPFAIDTSGAVFVDMGSATNSCQLKNRTLHSPGHQPCTELATRGGIWRFDGNRTGQHFSPSARYATGIRNAVGIAFTPNGALFSTQHGRDQLSSNWPEHYTTEQSAELPAEELMHIEHGADYGWPFCYFDGSQKKLMLAPEYGGDGTKVGLCDKKRAPVAFFPAHWAPDGLTFYSGSSFPAHYRGGAFIAFHGSWNRAPLPQGGYLVAFVPFQGDTASGPYETFADGFAGANKQPDAAAHRPAGVAVGPDGALYIADDAHGRVWRVTYHGAAGQ
ncbi:MAG TPA: PQQ-dependent sugar dehydrogenase [Gemmatimonadaceae bacterium]|nr:PQQ-dependent sugar dehydrogenase [Gemmatimonadaceae bacterium]